MPAAFDAARRHFGGSLRTAVACGAALMRPAGLAALVAGCDRREPAPDIGFTLLDGRRSHVGALRAKVVLVNFWATSCTVCVAEMPGLVDTFRRFQARGLETLAVAMQHDPPALVSRFAETHALPFGVVIDSTGSVARAFGNVRVTPTTFVIDRRGAVAHRFVGAPDFAALHRRLDALLAEPA